jgi:hypothetical protein
MDVLKGSIECVHTVIARDFEEVLSDAEFAYSGLAFSRSLHVKLSYLEPDGSAG